MQRTSKIMGLAISLLSISSLYSMDFSVSWCSEMKKKLESGDEKGANALIKQLKEEKTDASLSDKQQLQLFNATQWMVKQCNDKNQSIKEKNIWISVLTFTGLLGVFGQAFKKFGYDTYTCTGKCYWVPLMVLIVPLSLAMLIPYVVHKMSNPKRLTTINYITTKLEKLKWSSTVKETLKKYNLTETVSPGKLRSIVYRDEIEQELKKRKQEQ